MHNLKSPIRTNGRRSRGFTLIEILVVVAIIALLISILLPSLARAREQARNTLCMTNSKQMSNATLMYTVDHKSRLFGPIHMLIYSSSYALKTLETPTAYYWKTQPGYYLQKYLSPTRDYRAELLDRVATCPTAAGIKVEKIPTNPSPVYKLPSGHYIMNTGGGVNSGTATNHVTPLYGTKPRNYFGYVKIPYNPATLNDPNVIDTATGYNYAQRTPKKIEKIPQLSREWMMADLWYWDAAAARGSNTAQGTWPYSTTSTDQANDVNSVRASTGFKIPTYPYHLTLDQQDPNGADHQNTSPRLTSGKTNATFMDGHGETIMRWKGTANPCFTGMNCDG